MNSFRECLAALCEILTNNIVAGRVFCSLNVPLKLGFLRVIYRVEDRNRVAPSVNALGLKEFYKSELHDT